MKTQRIHIIGGAGSGKTYLAKLLSEKLQIPHHDLDDLFWDNSTDSFDIRRDPGQREAMLLMILQEESWIMEGVYYGWLQPSFVKVDKIIILQTPLLLRETRIVKRFIIRKFTRSPHKKKETFQGLFALLKWNRRFDHRQMPEIMNSTEPYAAKRIVIHNKRELNKLLTSL